MSASDSYELLPPADSETPMPIDESRTGDHTSRLIAITAASLTVIISWFAILSNEPIAKGWFAFHPLLISLALLLSTHAILTLQPTSTLSSKASGLSRHITAILYSATPLFFLGVLAVWWNKEAKGKDHFKTWHGKLGLVTTLVFLVQLFLGAGSVFYDGRLFGGGIKAKLMWKYHRALGYTLFILVIFTSHLGGFWSGWASRNTAIWTRWLAYAIAPLAIVGAVAWRIRFSKIPIFS